MCEQGGNIKCVNRVAIYRVCEHGSKNVAIYRACEHGCNIECEHGNIVCVNRMVIYRVQCSSHVLLEQCSSHVLL